MQSNSCSVPYTSAGNTFDLMELSDVNYRTTDRQGNFFIINVCKPVLYGENTMCPAGSSICLFSPKATDLKKRCVRLYFKALIMKYKLLLMNSLFEIWIHISLFLIFDILIDSLTSEMCRRNPYIKMSSYYCYTIRQHRVQEIPNWTIAVLSISTATKMSGCVSDKRLVNFSL